MLSIASLPFQKKCGICHVVDVIIFPIVGVHCNTCHSKSTIQNLSFLCGSITTNNELVLFTVGGKWFEVIVHMTKL